MLDRVVVDSGFILEAILPTSKHSQEQAQHLIEKLQNGDIEAVVPWLFYAEIAAVCAKRVRARRLDKELAEEFLDGFMSLPIDIDLRLEGPLQLFQDAMQVGSQVYDTMYITLAKSMGLPVATVDKGMQQAAKAERVTLWAA